MGSHKVSLTAPSPKIVVDTLRQARTISITDLQRKTGFKQNMVTGTVHGLIMEDMVHVSAWVEDYKGFLVRQITWGEGENVPRPDTKRKRNVHMEPHELLPFPRADVAAAWLNNEVAT